MLLFVLAAENAEQAIIKTADAIKGVLREPRFGDRYFATFLGLDGTDELAHAEDAWAMRCLEERLFNYRTFP